VEFDRPWIGRDLKEDGVLHDSSYLDILCVRARGYNRTWLAVDELPYGGCGEGEGSAHLACPAFNLNDITILGARLVRDVDVGRDSRLGAIVPGCNGHAANPVYQGRRDGTVDASMRVYVVLSKRELCAHDAFGGIGQLDVVEQELVDGAARLAALPELFNMREDLGVVGCVARHVCYGAGVLEGEVTRGSVKIGMLGQVENSIPALRRARRYYSAICDQQAAAAVKRPVRQC
jgi:hypothetical protein